MYKIMIVDDREIFRRKFKRFEAVRENRDFEIAYEASNGKEALEILREHSTDLVITDIRMPIMDGMELLEEIKTEKLCSCVVLLSEYADFSYAQKGIALGAFSYCVKPIENADLKEVLAKVKVFLDEEARKDHYLPNQVEVLIQMLLEGNPETGNQAAAIAEETAAAKHMNNQDIYYTYQQMLHAIWEKLTEKKPYIDQFICMEDYFLRQEEQTASLIDAFTEVVARLADQICRLHLPTTNSKIAQMNMLVLENVENDISLQKISEDMCISKTYLSHLFKEETGIGFMEFVTQAKMAHAKVLLHNQEIKIYEVSALLGYDDVEYFSRKFREAEGVLPTGYRSGLVKSR